MNNLQSFYPFLPNVSILNPLKTPVILWISRVFMGFKMETLTKNGLMLKPLAKQTNDNNNNDK